MPFMTDKPARAGFWIVLLLSVFAWAPATYPGYWQALEGFTPLFNAAAPAAVAGVAATPDLWRGAGSGAFLLAQPFLALGLSPAAAVRASFALCLLLGGLGVYTWISRRFGDRAGGLAGLLYMLLPPVLATVYIRGSLSNALLLALLPLALAAAAAYADRRSPTHAAVLLISLVWLWRAQAGLALFATLLLLAYTWFVEQSRLTTLVVAVAAAAGLTSLLPLWSLNGPPPAPFTDHFLYFFQLFGRGWEPAPSIPGWQDRYPFQLGFALWGFAALALWLLLQRGSADWPAASRRLLHFSFAAAALCILLSLNISAFVWRITGAERLLTYPWQIILPAAPFLAAVAGSLPALDLRFRQGALWPALLVLTLLSSTPYLSAAFIQVQPPSAPLAVFGANDLVLLSADLTESDGAATLQVVWQPLRPLPFDYNVFFQALAQTDGATGGPTGNAAEGAEAVVAQLDAQPLDGARPATTWTPGEVLTDTYRLDLPPSLSSQDGAPLRYVFGYYDWRDGSRLPVDGGISDKVVLYGR